MPQRELRNDIARVLREVSAGETVEITVRGRVVAQLSPPRRREPVDRATALELLGSAVDDSWLPELLSERRAAEDEEPEHWT